MTPERIEELEAEVKMVRLLNLDADDTIGDMLDNQAWIMLSHIAARLDSGNPDLMEEWQDAYAEGKVQKGYFSPHRGAAAWIARECNALIKKAVSEQREADARAGRGAVLEIIDYLKRERGFQSTGIPQDAARIADIIATAIEANDV